MASRILSLYCLFITALLTDCREGTSLKLSLGFTALSPPEVIAQKNRPLLLNCSGYSEEGRLQISWRHQDIDIKDRHLQTFPNGSLYIEKVVYQKKRERRWDGNYTCLLRNNVGILVSRPIHVVLARMSRSFTSEPQPLSIHEGGNARFSCQINALPLADVVWYKDGIELPHNDSRYTFLPSGTLHVIGVSSSDEGSYSCRCTNVVRQRISSEATLTVLQEVQQVRVPLFLSLGEQVQAITNEPSVLECIADGVPGMELSWRREDGSVIPNMQLLGLGNLYFPNTQPDNGGSYICTIKYLHPESHQVASITQKVSLTVYVPPQFTTAPQSQVKPTAQTARFECGVRGIPFPSVYWMKDGRPLYINGRIKLKPGNVLVVSQTVITDSGIYQCVSSNAAGVTTSAARLQVTASSNQPYPPTGLKARTISSNAILLSWDAATSPATSSIVSPIQAYTVHYVPSHGGLEQDIVAVNTSHLIDRLKPYTNYTFYVRAYNGKSASEQSEAVVQMTGEDVPVSAPTIFLTSLSPTTLHVQWNELALDKMRGVVTGHRIHYRKHKQASYSVIEVPNVATEYTITGLIPKKKYDVRVMSGTKAGFPVLNDNSWPWVLYEMPDTATAKVPQPPILHLTVLNTTALEVEWSMPANNSYNVDGFYLSHRQQNHPLKHRIDVPANVTKFLLYDLVPQSWYEVHIVAYNTDGESRDSVRTIITFSGDNPDVETVEVVEPPHQLEAEPTSSTSIHLIWKNPLTNRNISYYTVRYHPVFISGLVNESHIYYIRSTNNEVVITDLQPFTLYEFSVRSHDVHNHQGPFSQKVECRTDEALPSPPDELTWAPVDASSVRLNWQAPKFPNGIITAYFIMYSVHIDETNLNKWVSKEEKGEEFTSLVTGLSSNTLYYFCMKAKNGAGLGKATPIIALNIPVRHNNSRLPNREMYDAEPPDPFLGVVLGISIGVGCIIICAIIIIFRNRCCPPPPPPAADGRYSMCCGNGYVPQVNGNVLPKADKRTSSIECQEMECFTPMLNHYPASATDRHLDTKGGYPTSMCNGKVNGFAHPLLGNSHSSLGSQQDSVGSVQVSNQGSRPVSKQRMRYTSTDCDLPNDSWQEDATDVTSSTVLLDETIAGRTTPAKDGKSSSRANNEDTESSFTVVMEGDPSQHSPLPPEPQKTVPQKSCPVPLAEASNCSDSNVVLSNQQQEGGSSTNAGETSAFSVNAFLSPITSPRFVQTSLSVSSELT